MYALVNFIFMFILDELRHKYVPVIWAKNQAVCTSQYVHIEGWDGLMEQYSETFIIECIYHIATY